MKSRATEELNEALKPLKEKSFAAKGLRSTDVSEVMSTPPEGYAPGIGRDIRTGTIYNQARRFTSDVAKPAMRTAGRATAGLGIIGELAEYDNEQKANRKSTQREDISGGPNAEISAKGSSINPRMQFPRDDSEDRKSATEAYTKWKNSQEPVTRSNAEDSVEKKSAPRKSANYSHDISPKQKRTIREQAISDMRARADAGDGFWKGQLEKALRERA